MDLFQFVIDWCHALVLLDSLSRFANYAGCAELLEIWVNG